MAVADGRTDGYGVPRDKRPSPSPPPDRRRRRGEKLLLPLLLLAVVAGASLSPSLSRPPLVCRRLSRRRSRVRLLCVRPSGQTGRRAAKRRWNALPPSRRRSRRDKSNCWLGMELGWMDGWMGGENNRAGGRREISKKPRRQQQQQLLFWPRVSFWHLRAGCFQRKLLAVCGLGECFTGL